MGLHEHGHRDGGACYGKYGPGNWLIEHQRLGGWRLAELDELGLGPQHVVEQQLAHAGDGLQSVKLPGLALVE
jgi:hypothetical protein